MAAAAGSDRRLKPLNLNVRPTRKLAAIQAYSKLYYTSKLKPIVDKAWEEYVAQNPDQNGGKGEQLRQRNMLLAKLLHAETKEIKEKVERYRKEGIASGDESSDISEPDNAGDSTSNKEKLRRAKAYAFQKYVLFLVHVDMS